MRPAEWMVNFKACDKYLAVPVCLLQTKSLPASAAIVYAAIADEDSDDDGEIRLKHAKIMQKTGYSRRQVLYAIDALIAADLLEPEPDRTGRANIYRLTTRLLPPKPKKRRRAEPPEPPPEESPDNVYYQDFLEGV